MADAPPLGLKLDPGTSTPLFAQIYEALRRRIISGQLGTGYRLPASRNLAQELGVSRATVVAAYDQLMAEGFAQGRRGAGVYVSDIGEVEIDQASHTPVAALPDVTSPPSPPIRPFQPGRPDMRLFPYRQWARCFSRVARSDPQALVVGSDPFGDLHLRTAIVRYLADWRGLNVSPQQILITAGSVDALEICLRTLASPGDFIALEDPGYAPLRSLIGSLGMRPRWLELDAHGACLPDIGAGVKTPVLAMLTPSSQFPLGGAMPTKRRVEFLSWAQRTDSWIVEDDYDSEFRYAGRPIPALASFEPRFDQGGRTLYLGSFSKVFTDSLRLGFLVVPMHILERISMSVRAHGTKASIAPQRALALFMENGEFYRHIRRMRRMYGERRSVLVGLLRDQLGHIVSFEDHHAGMQIVVRLAPQFDDVQIAKLAAQRGVTCAALSSYYACEPKVQGLLLGFCGFSPQELKSAVNVLREVLESV